LELTDKDFKAAMIDVLKDLKENVLIINRREIVKKQKQQPDLALRITRRLPVPLLYRTARFQARRLGARIERRPASGKDALVGSAAQGLEAVL